MPARHSRSEPAPSRDLAPSRRLLPAAIPLLLALSVVPFLPCLSGRFLNWDDNSYVTDNPAVKWPNGPRIGRILTRPYYTDYSPVFVLALSLEYQLTRGEAIGFRVLGVALHAAGTLLVLLLVRQISKDTLVAGAAAAVFAVHPVQVESVCWITEQKNLLSLIFLLLAFWAFVRYDESARPAAPWYVAALALAILAYWTKPSTVILPVLLGCYLIALRRRPLKEVAVRLLPFLMLALLATGLAIHAQRKAGAVAAWHGGTPYTNLLSMLPVWAGYARVFLLPHDLCALRENVAYASSWNAPVMAGLLFLLVLIGAAVWCWRASRPVFFWLLWVPIALLPVANLIPMKNTMAERYLHLPLVGLAAIAGWLIARAARLSPLWMRRGFLVLVLVVVLALGTISWHRAHVWRDSLSLWRDSVLQAPGVLTSRLNLGLTHIDEGWLATGEEILDRARPSGGKELGRWYEVKGNLALRLGRGDALDLLLKAREADPDRAAIRYYLGVAYGRAGRIDDAEQSFRGALRLKPDHVEARGNLATLLMERGLYEEAEREYRRAIRDSFLPYREYYNLATLYRKMNRPGDAAACYREVLRLAPPDFPRRAEAERFLGDVPIQP